MNSLEKTDFYDLVERIKDSFMEIDSDIMVDLKKQVPLGTDIYGNITRLDNKMNELPDNLSRCREQLETAKSQLETAKVEAQKEFPQEKELAEKVARLGELNVLLDMDKKDRVVMEEEPETEEIEPEREKTAWVR